jgi:putative peptidoglycan lipid II flippase
VRRTGFRYRPLWGWDRRLSETGSLALWVVGYVLIGQAGYVVTTRVAAQAAPGSVAIYSNAWLLLQVPYGVLGVSLLTALMPRMSRAAAEGRTTDVVADLGLGCRLSAVVLLPVSVLLTLFGTQLGIALFSLGAGGVGGGATRLGAALAASAFGLLPYAVTMLQLRVFYALTDSRTPTLLQLATVGVKVPLLLAAPSFLSPEWVVLGLAAANGFSFVVGAVLGQVVLYRRLGPLGTAAVLGSLARMTVAAVLAGLLAFGVVLLVAPALPPVGPVAGSWIELVIAAVVGAPAVVGTMLLMRVPELTTLRSQLRRRVGPDVTRPTGRGDSGQ